ncbi:MULTISPECIES: nitrogenase iron-molybdenum cofactor biosynthesis protein NifN [Rhizobium]|uniref:Nitrogenase iron-molybdenum cofactor biosynthesis protein NifN n=1 Tax=Rhizobium leguminosarum bv. viciae TaxID=387 RepID=A0A8G2MLY1_RHILV|nr:nitrogenase iron-molybdenum cofactor biosynthesis protein NifN [Rhizobium leguminosarum]NKK10464.1 nitrogenase iron-molybdenum cofactor biosynthesis protein NifN [Rhizobium leguminosarum bv. viciae]NKK23618.1 nitrogenase iron-molybdenum cofactor biosynthesis protein NifN [Rhizobium leguminosarum bv. viciae]TBX85083.1 nitrogenase iron-molybdenum cofactor biosynthesis protein NifN [Rhizobium leguminosarum bv. viciae]TBY74083.1 nitrogenase iron-molybdenum cofactor biosynthesis protein NifN [Rhi
MARVVSQTKSAAVNPLKSSQPLGAAFAFLGVDGAIPLLHGSQGCTSFALALLVRHFNEAIPLQTTAMNEAAIIVGGADRLEEAILSLKARSRPRLIGICTTASVEARDEDVAGDVENIKRRRAIELVGTEVIVANTPDFDGAIEEGWSKAVTAVIEAIARPDKQYRNPRKIAILPGWNLTVADIEHLRETAVSFGLDPVILPDVSGALDGSIPEEWMPTTYGGTKVEEIRDLGATMQCIAIGEHMRRPAEALQRLTGVPYVLFRSLTGLENVDRFIRVLAAMSRKQTPLNVRRNRMQLQDAMLDGHFHMAGKKIAIASEPDQLFQLSDFLTAMGAEIAAAVTTTGTSKALEMVPAKTVKVGDLSDLESLAATADLIVTHSHGREAAKRLGIPLMRLGLPMFDRVGSQHKLTILYRGTRDVIFDLANIIQANHPPDSQPTLLKRQAGIAK